MLRWVWELIELGKYGQLTTHVIILASLSACSCEVPSTTLLFLPSPQFASWVDAVILVFSLENEASFQEVYKIYHQLAVHRPISEIPFIVVGTQGQTLAHNTGFQSNACRGVMLSLCFLLFLDKISSTNPRVIDDARARQLCSDVRRCTYYETCATYGLNVNRVFTDGTCPSRSQTRASRILPQKMHE